jgi:outer membrane receptor for ferrienterochelin and colicins
MSIQDRAGLAIAGRIVSLPEGPVPKLFISIGLRSLFLPFLLLSLPTHGQRIELEGRGGRALPDAHITLSPTGVDSSIMLLSGDRGVATVNDSLWPSFDSLTLRISYVGYQTLTDTFARSVEKEIDHRLKASEVLKGAPVVTAQYSQGAQEGSVHKVDVIEEEEIEDQGAVNLRDIMQKETNVRVSRDNVLGSSASMQGISGQNVKILVDGVPVIGRLNGNIDLSQINLNNVKRIEVVEGPLSVNYGTDALAGTINIITKKGGRDSLNVAIDSYYGTVGRYNLDGRASVKAGKGRLSLSGGRNYFDGWSPDDPFTLYPKAMPADTNRNKPWDPKEQYFGRLQYHYRSEDWRIRPYVQYFDEEIIDRGAPRDPYHETAFDNFYQTRRMKGGLDLSRTLDEDRELRILASYNRYDRTKNTYFKDLTTLEKRLTEAASDQDSTRFDLWMSRGTFSNSSDSSGIGYEIGYDVNYEKAFSQRIEGTVQDQGDYALFGSLEWSPIEELILRPGLRYGYNTGYDAPLIPSMNVRYQKERFTIRTSYARGFRAPSLKELHFRFVDVNHNIHGNPDLEAEKSDNLSLDLTWKKVASSSIWELEGGAFYNSIRDRISLARVRDTRFRYVNIGRYKTLGFDLGAEWIREQLRIRLDGAYTGRYNVISENHPVRPFSFSPEIRSSVRYRFPEWNARAAAFYEYTGALPGFTTTANGEGIQRTRIGSYQILDITLSKSFWNERLEWTLGIKNLFDVQNVDATGTGGRAHSGGGRKVPVGRGRSYFTELSFQFSK